MKIWAPPPSWLTLVDQEGGGDFFCPPLKDQPVDSTVEIYLCFTVKNKFRKMSKFWRVFLRKNRHFWTKIKRNAASYVSINLKLVEVTSESIQISENRFLKLHWNVFVRIFTVKTRMLWFWHNNNNQDIFSRIVFLGHKRPKKKASSEM